MNKEQKPSLSAKQAAQDYADDKIGHLNRGMPVWNGVHDAYLAGKMSAHPQEGRQEAEEGGSIGPLRDRILERAIKMKGGTDTIKSLSIALKCPATSLYVPLRQLEDENLLKIKRGQGVIVYTDHTFSTPTKGRQLYEVVPENEVPTHIPKGWIDSHDLNGWKNGWRWLRPVSTHANIEAQDTEGQKGGGC